MAALGAQSIASSYEQLLHVDADGGGTTTTHVSVKDGDNGTTFALTLATDAVMITSTNRLEFGDDGTYIHQSADGVLDLVSDTEIEINATTIDVNGALDLSGNAQLSGTVTVGADGSGTDVIFYSGTAGDNFTWDASEEKLTITGTNAATALDVADGNVTIADDLAVDGTANLDEVDIDGAVQIDNTITVGADDQGYDVIFYGDTASSNMTWDTSEDDLVLNDATLKIDQDDDASSFTIDSEATSATVINLNGMASTTGKIINIDDCDALTTGSALHINSNSSSTGTRNLVEIVNNHASATGAVNLFLDQNANNEALFIDAENTTIGAVDIHWLDMISYPRDFRKSTTNKIKSILSSPIMLYLMIGIYLTITIIDPLQKRGQAYFYSTMFNYLLVGILFGIHYNLIYHLEIYFLIHHFHFFFQNKLLNF